MFNWFRKKKDADRPKPKAEGYSTNFGKPQNELEEHIFNFRNREIEAQTFILNFLNSFAYVCTKEGQFKNENGQIQLVQNPFLFTITNPNYASLCFYSENNRINPTVEKYPEFKYAVKVRAGDLIMGLQPGMGIILNPYWEVNLEWNPSQIEQIKAMVK